MNYDLYVWGCPGEYGECENCGKCAYNQISQAGQNLTYYEDDQPLPF